MAIELIAVNLAGTIREEEYEGRKHLVVPMTMIREGVLNGSKGPLFYPVDEIGRSASDWNNIPIVVYHPFEDGKAVSARQPHILNRSSIGKVFKAELSDSSLVAEGWFDIERTRQVDHRILNNLKSGNPIELSTGLVTENADGPGEYNGIKYNATARNYKPDHLAILPDQTGACSLKDGCGVGVLNEAMTEFIANQISFNDVREALQLQIDGGIMGPKGEERFVTEVFDDYFILRTPEGKLWKMRYAVKGNKVTISDNTPEEVQLVTSYETVTNEEGEDLMAKLTKARRQEIIANLVANCDCWSEDDSEVLNAMTDAKLEAFDKHIADHQYKETIANAALEGSQAGNHEFKYDADKGEFVANEIAADPDDEEEQIVNEKPKTLKDWMSDPSTPPEVKAVVANAQAREAQDRDGWIETITANEGNTFTKDELAAFASPQLEKMAGMMAPKQEAGTTANYRGAAAPGSGGADAPKEEALPLPTMNFENERLSKALGN